MLKILLFDPLLPEKPLTPKQIPDTSGAPPFTAAVRPKPQQPAVQSKPQQPAVRPKPQQPAVQPAASVTQSRRQPARTTTRQKRSSTQAASDERASTSGSAGDANASTRPDSQASMLSGEFFDEFDDTSDDSMSEGGAGAPLEETMDVEALDEQLDCAALASVLPTGENDGVFDVVLPSGDRLGVVVSGRPSSLSYLLSPSSEKLSSRLRRRRMELEERLEQLTHRNVNITVL